MTYGLIQNLFTTFAIFTVNFYIIKSALQDRHKFPLIYSIYVNFLCWHGTTFFASDLIDADFSYTNLKGVSFENAVLDRANFTQAQGLCAAKLNGTILYNYLVRDLVTNRRVKSSTNYSGINFRGVNLRGSILEDAEFNNSDFTDAVLIEASFAGSNLKEAKLNGSNCEKTDFRNAVLVQTQLDKASLVKANFTGATIENWVISQSTKLDKIHCKYVYLIEMQNGRFPTSGDFKPGEFEIFVNKIRETININFGVNSMSENENTGKRIINANNYYEQTGMQGIGHISGGTIERGVKVAGTINETNETKSNDIAVVAAEIMKLLDYFEQNNPPITEETQQIIKAATDSQPDMLDAEIIQEAIYSNPTLRQRLLSAGAIAYIETLKILLPPFAIAYETVKAFRDP